jgi:hypothetical protein
MRQTVWSNSSGADRLNAAELGTVGQLEALPYNGQIEDKCMDDYTI